MQPERTHISGAGVDRESMECTVCSAKAGREHVFREMMFGTRKEFSYWECLACGRLQIEKVPEDLEHFRFYFRPRSFEYLRR
jgi:hypothetical protein